MNTIDTHFTQLALDRLKSTNPNELEYEVGQWLIFNKEHVKRKFQSMVTILALVLEEPVAYETFIEFCNKGLLKIIKEEIETSFLLNGEELVQVMDQQWIEWLFGETLLSLTKE